MTSSTPAAFAASLAPSLIWLKNSACWLIVTSAIVLASASDAPSVKAAAAQSASVFESDIPVFLLEHNAGRLWGGLQQSVSKRIQET